MVFMTGGLEIETKAEREGRIQFDRGREYFNPYSKITQVQQWKDFEYGRNMADMRHEKNMKDPNYFSSIINSSA